MFQNPILIKRLILCFGAILAVSLILLTSLKYTSGDFDVYYYSSQQYLVKAPVYIAHGGINEFKYSPLFALVFSPLTLLGKKPAIYIWTIINVCFFYGIFFLLNKLKQFTMTNYKDFIIVFILLALTGRFIFENFRIGQVNMMLNFFLVLTMYFEINKKYHLAAAALAFSLMIKLFPLLFLIYFIIKKRFELIAYTFLFIIFFLLIPAIYSGWGMNIQYLHQWLFLLKSSPPVLMYSIKNNSLLSFFSWFFIARHEIYGVYDYDLIQKVLTPGVYYAWGISCLVLFIAFFKDVISNKDKDPKITYLEYSCLFVCVLLFNPLAYLNALTFLIVPYFFILRFLLDLQLNQRNSIFSIFILLLTFFLTLLDNTVFFKTPYDFRIFLALKPLMWVLIFVYLCLYGVKGSLKLKS